jgi:hypothetical protein
MRAMPSQYATDGSSAEQNRQRVDARHYRLEAALREHLRRLGEQHPDRVQPILCVAYSSNTLSVRPRLAERRDAAPRHGQLRRRDELARALEQELAEGAGTHLARAVAARDEEMPAVAVLRSLGARAAVSSTATEARMRGARHQHEQALVRRRDAVEDLAGEVREHRVGRDAIAVVGQRRAPLDARA